MSSAVCIVRYCLFPYLFVCLHASGTLSRVRLAVCLCICHSVCAYWFMCLCNFRTDTVCAFQLFCVRFRLLCMCVIVLVLINAAVTTVVGTSVAQTVQAQTTQEGMQQ